MVLLSLRSSASLQTSASFQPFSPALCFAPALRSLSPLPSPSPAVAIVESVLNCVISSPFDNIDDFNLISYNNVRVSTM